MRFAVQLQLDGAIHREGLLLEGPVDVQAPARRMTRRDLDRASRHAVGVDGPAFTGRARDGEASRRNVACREASLLLDIDIARLDDMVEPGTQRLAIRAGTGLLRRSRLVRLRGGPLRYKRRGTGWRRP